MATDNVDTTAAFTYVWTVENCLSSFALDCIESPGFKVESLGGTWWHLEINEKSEQFLSISIHREECSGPDVIEVVFQLALLTRDATCIKREDHRRQFFKGGFFELSEPTKRIFKSQRDQYLPNDTLTLRCQMWGVGLNPSRPNMCFAASKLGLDRRTIFFNIRNFTNFAPGQEEKYHITPMSGENLVLSIAICGMESNGNEDILVKFSEDSKTKIVRFNCDISVLDSNGRKCLSRRGRNLSTSSDVFVYIFNKHELIHKNPSLLLDDVLCIRCELEIGYGAIWNDIEFYLHQPFQTA
ncbi:MATH domain-containing protein [Trichonephila clavata]|uniref:MATH domain-containing protein n=1 Tax=Trichonephila clavata TaxID=2740835 RepID=A0A8X6J5Y9_TRICU|nr:MATH domain-containing protein [Trichonephila clavata]